jgi:hypothetical protein
MREPPVNPPRSWNSTEFWQSLGVQITATIALFTEHIPPDVWGWTSAAILGVYTTNRTFQKRVEWDHSSHSDRDSSWNERDDRWRDRDHNSDLDEWDRSNSRYRR